MQIVETASHHPFQDHELSISRHVPEKEYPSQRGQVPPTRVEPESAREGRGDVDPLTPIMVAMGGIGRTPIPVAESTHHPGEKPFTPDEVPRGERSDQRGESPTHEQDQGETAEGVRGDQQEGESEWALPEPSDPRRPPGESAVRGEVPP